MSDSQDQQRHDGSGRGHAAAPHYLIQQAINATAAAEAAAKRAEDMTTRSEAAASRVCEVTDRLERILTGGEEPAKGLVTRFEVAEAKAQARVEEAERAEERRRWLIRTTLGAAIAALVLSVWKALFGSPPVKP